VFPEGGVCGETTLMCGARFFMVDRRRNGDELREEFSVLGSTGNVYTVVIDKKPSCNCKHPALPTV
jgi:hypothetical protein